MTPEQYLEVEAKVRANLESELQSLQQQLEESERNLSLSLAANTKLTQNLRTTITRAEEKIAESKYGTVLDYALIAGSLLLGGLIGHYGTKWSRRFPILSIPGLSLIALGAGAYRWKWQTRSALVVGGVPMFFLSINTFIQENLPPRATV